jgi:hypothetical protein
MTTSIGLGCACKVTQHGTARHPREMLLPANMCDEHRAQYEAFHAASMTERAQARAALETGGWDDLAQSGVL